DWRAAQRAYGRRPRSAGDHKLPECVPVRPLLIVTRSRAYLFASRFQFPVLIEEIGVDDLAGVAAVGRSPQVDDRPIGNPWHLTRVAEVVVIPECKAAVEHHVPAGIKGIGINHDEAMLAGRIVPLANFDLVGIPTDGKLVGNLLE